MSSFFLLLAVGAYAASAPKPTCASFVRSIYEGDLASLTAAVQKSRQIVNCATERDGSPVYAAVSRYDAKILKFLVEHGADLENAKPGAGMSDRSLYVIAAGDGPVIDYLLARKLDVHGSEVVEHYASWPGDNQTEIVAKLLAAGGAPGRALFHVTRAETVDVLLKKGASVNARDNDGFTPLLANVFSLQTSQRTHSLAAIGRLLDAGADVNAVDPKGYGALHMATDLEVVKMLVAHHADLNLKTKDGQTPLRVLETLEPPTSPKVLKYLRERGATSAPRP